MSEFKVGGVYKCGDTFVKIVKDMWEDSDYPDFVIPFIGIQCDKYGGFGLDLHTGIYATNGRSWPSNPAQLNHNLEPIQTQRQKDHDALMKQITELEARAAKLKP